MGEEEKKPVEEFLEEVHGDQSPAKGMGLNVDLTITKNDVDAYLYRHPFLQLLNLDPTFEDFDEVKFIESQSGWTFHDFGDALSASQGKLMYHDFGLITLMAFSQEEEDEDEDEDGGEGEGEFEWEETESDMEPGKGTFIKQGVDTATDMIELIRERWKGVHIVQGTELMKWAAWKAARGYDLEVYGFEPDNKARVKRSVVERAQMQQSMGKSRG